MPDDDRAQLDKFKQAVRDLEAGDDPKRFAERLGKLVKHNPVEKPEGAISTGTGKGHRGPVQDQWTTRAG